MGFESAYQFREVELLIDSTGPGTFVLSTEQPGSDLSARVTVSVDTPTSTRRLPIRVFLSGTTRGCLPQFRLTPQSGSAIALFGVRVYATLIGSGVWKWYGVPCQVTPEAWDVDVIPIPPTPEAWTVQLLPLRPTAENWQWADLPVDEL